MNVDSQEIQKFEALAHRWWDRSLSVAKEMRAPYELALTQLEMGRLTGDNTLLESAATAFAQLGARHDLGRAESLRPTVRAGL